MVHHNAPRTGIDRLRLAQGKVDEIRPIRRTSRASAWLGIRLRIRLGRSARRLHWANIWLDPAGAASVRAANDDNETVPTVVVAGQPHTNPDPEWVREQLAPST